MLGEETTLLDKVDLIVLQNGRAVDVEGLRVEHTELISARKLLLPIIYLLEYLRIDQLHDERLPHP